MPSPRRRLPAASPPMKGRLLLETPLGGVLSDRRIRLLEAIGELGSLNRAARAVPLSYKAAWDALDAMNQLAPQPLVERATGGAGGGGTTLTPYARQLIALYREIEQRQQSVLDRLPPLPPEADAPALRTLVRRLSMKTSARNQWPAQVVDLADRGGLVDVTLALGEREAPGETVVATITPESAETMALAAGSEVLVLLKAPSVRLALRAPRHEPGRNVLHGVVDTVRPGQRHTGVTLRLASGRHLSAVVAPDRAASLAPGAPAVGIFDGDQVVLLSFG